ncbi:MAG: CvpA family protein [Candidatus Levybacteria bacterium]|nr:CvpA family protein [Candidatus Levybacteria bacterium]
MEILFSINDSIAQIFSVLSFRQYGINMLDIVIIFVVLFYVYEGYTNGFILSALDLCSFIVSFLLGLLFFDKFGGVVTQLFSVPTGFANALGFLCIAGITEFALSIFLRRFSLPAFFHKKTEDTFIGGLNRFFGVLPGLACSYILLSFLLTVIVALPSSPVLKNLVATSRFGSALVSHAAKIQHDLNGFFGESTKDNLNVLTIKPQSEESVKLHFTVDSPSVDKSAEKEMFDLVNEERKKAGLPLLSVDDELTKLARSYATDMLKMGFFSHYDLENRSPFDRMNNAGIGFVRAGENLALSPGVSLAHQGLMNSPGHKANILSPHYHKVGIGVMDGGIYGQMFVQEFTD